MENLALEVRALTKESNANKGVIRRFGLETCQQFKQIETDLTEQLAQ
jgi:hypothetical protein